ncbi:MAG: DNA repair protein [Oscillospiraceae bacterium]|nr:DNA repair protein [Oscillospiraceae bacterium]
MQSQYLVIDQKSYYASVECVIRNMDPMNTNLIVADPDRSKNTICLAVSPSMKALGVKNRCRLRDIPSNIKYIIAPPQMQLYIDCAAEIHGVFLKHFAPQDIFTYSIDESFIDATPYLKMYNIPTRELAKRVIDDVYQTVGTISTCGIGTNMFLAKVALDIQAKHDPDFIAELDENQYREKLWEHKPLTDFWRIGPGTAKRLWDRGITTMGGIAHCDLNRIYDWFGIDGELLYDHAWGREPTTIADVKAYNSNSRSLSSGQVLMHDYSFSAAEIIAKEMMDQLCLDMAAKKLATESVSLYVGYSYTYGVPGVGGTAKLAYETNAAAVIVPAIAALYRRIVNPTYGIRRVCLTCNNVVQDNGHFQLNMFEDTTKQLRNKALQDTILGIRSKYGKNAILRGISYTPESTARERNLQIGGHKSGIEDSSRTNVKIKTG